MEYFNIFLEVLRLEKERFKLDDSVFISYTSALTPTLSENFDIPYNRCAYMYRYATCNMHFAKKCISTFLSEYPLAKQLLGLWRSHRDLDMCSLSCGPGLDYLSFALAVSEFGEDPDMFRQVRILTKYGAWRNTVNLLVECLANVQVSSSVPKNVNYQNVKVSQANFKKTFTVDIISVLQSSEVVLMFKTLNLTAPGSQEEEADLLSNLNALVSCLRPEATIFFIDTKPSVSLMQKALSESPGYYLLDPVHVPYMHPEPFPETFREKLSIFPVLSARGTFFVWQKYPIELWPADLIALPPPCLALEKGEVAASNGITQFPVVKLLDDLPERMSSISSNVKPINNSTLPNGRNLEFQSPVATGPDLPGLGGSEANLPVLQRDRSRLTPKSKSSTSTCSSRSDILDSMLKDFLNSSPLKNFLPPGGKPSKRTESFASDDSGSKSKCAATRSSHPDLVVLDKSGSSPVNPVVTPFSVPPVTINAERRSTLRPSHKKNSKKREVIQNLLDGKYAKPDLQTDPVVAESDHTNHSDSIKVLTDSINKLTSAFEKELKDPCGHHINRCSSFMDPVHCCSSLSLNCENEHARSLPRFEGKNHQLESASVPLAHDAGSERAFSECTTSSVRCDHCCSASGCCSPRTFRCCHGQQSLQPSGSFFANGTIHVTAPSIVIPLKNINMDLLSQLLSDAKSDLQSS